MPDYEPRTADTSSPAGGHARPRAAGHRRKQGRAAASRGIASSRPRPDRVERLQLLATAVRIAIELLEPFLDRFFGGPGRLL